MTSAGGKGGTGRGGAGKGAQGKTSAGKTSMGKTSASKTSAGKSGARKPGTGRASPVKPGPVKSRPAQRAAAQPSAGKPAPSPGAGSGGAKGAASSSFGAQRQLKQRLRTARGRTVSQQRWLERQLNDPYVAAAKADGYRSRAAYKLSQIDDKAKLLKPGMRILDLGAAPGGWSQVAAERVRAVSEGGGSGGGGRGGSVVAVDLTTVEPIAGVTIMTEDFMADGAEARIMGVLGGKVDGVLSDMAAPSTGHKLTDHLRIIDLCDAALYFAEGILMPGGFFLCKVLQGGSEGQLLTRMKRGFRTVRHIKPGASRADSSELYVLATGFRGVPADDPEAGGS